MTTQELKIERPASMILATNQGLPKTHELAAMRTQLQRGDLPLATRWALTRQFNQALKIWFQDQIDKSLSVAETGTRAAANLKVKEIELYVTKFTLELRNAYLETMRGYGMRIEEEQLDFAIAAAEKLSEKLSRLAAANITPAFKERLIAMIEVTFDRMLEELNALTKDLFKTAGQPDAF